MTATPQDHLAEIPATITIETSKGSVTLPHPAKIPFGTLRKANQLGEAEQLFFMFENLATEETLAILDQLEMVELGQVHAQWSQGGSLGESSGSEN
jgi:hypothetical protein